ncbi:RHOMBOID-like protein 9, chloroplastic isoform X1 [Rhododendron vialii]|uniref:RHOMBOID-like protein 9, chloroplastic isoform X1 n=2 Tax=Rhododendron vialii TaxID=182163 RepID=UPI00265EA80C|nr:RHOMBOID-like protein 9, chloroplastic isoform X1 [Rhododendron vialii]
MFISSSFKRWIFNDTQPTMASMAVVPICYNMCYKDQCLLNSNGIGKNDKGFMWSFTTVKEDYGGFSTISGRSSRRGLLSESAGVPLKVSLRKGARLSQGMICNRRFDPFNTAAELSVPPTMHKLVCHLGSSSSNGAQQGKFHVVCHAYKSSLNEKQLESLDTYLGKLKEDADQPSSVFVKKREELSPVKAKRVLGTLEDYLGKVKKDEKSETYTPSTSDGKTSEATPYSVRVDNERDGWKKLKSYMKLKNKGGEGGPKSAYNETSDLYLIGIMVSINIAVFLFELASPIHNSDLEVFSVPLVYGAKINHLILLGEWWRLVTPMFLHSGIFHIALGCWMLLTFGPRVCRAYGSFTFFLLYILGGISGNLTSFLHIPDPTVGGTGPAFAIMGAFLIYQIQNKDVIPQDDFDNMIQKAIIATALSCLLSNFGPIDDWTHYGAAFTGIVYGYLTTPMLQMDDRSSKSGQEEGITLVRRNVNPCKSLVVFSLFVLVLSSLLFVVEPPLNSLPVGRFL